MSSKVAIAMWAVLALPLAASAAEKMPSDLVLVQQGTLPIILTAPHGGREPIPGIQPRDIKGKPKGGNRYVTGSDRNSDLIAKGVAEQLRALTGKAPYLVVAKFERRFIDPNRPPEIAYDSPSAAPFYEHYHQSIRRFVDEIRATYGDGLLIDVHTQGKIPGSIARGTLNGRAVRNLVARAGMEAVIGPQGLYGQLAANGFTVFPGNDVPLGGTAENKGFNGGYTVATYGSHTPNGIDAAQFEFGVNYRQDSELSTTIARAAKSIAVFYDAHLKRRAN